SRPSCEGGSEDPAAENILWPASGHNFLFNVLRVEPDVDEVRETADEAVDSVSGDRRPSELVEAFYLEQGLECAFGHPFLLRVVQGERAGSLMSAVQ
ncbi:unnamed protein product, partial [Polarella glacialis]